MVKLLNDSIVIATDWNDPKWREKETAMIEQARDTAKLGKTGDLVGEIIRFQIADGYASYMVVKQSPMTLRHIHIGDGYEVHPALIRGLTVAEIRNMVEQDRALRRLFGDN